MIYHYMKDGSRRDTIEGYIVKYEQKKELYKRLHKLNKQDKKEKDREYSKGKVIR